MASVVRPITWFAVVLRVVIVLLVLNTLQASRAQTPGTCVTGAAYADLDVNEVEARLYNTGALFYGNAGSGRYIVPKATGVWAIYVADLWVSGLVDDEIRVAGSRYDDFEFWPGPLGANATPPADCSLYDRIYAVSREDVQRYLATGEATDDLRDWPVELGAPVLDGDGDPANYDLAGGDQPAVWGDQTAWWIMNDVGNAHRETESAPLGLEVRGLCIARARLDLSGRAGNPASDVLPVRTHEPEQCSD